MVKYGKKKKKNIGQGWRKSGILFRENRMLKLNSHPDSLIEATSPKRKKG